MIIPQKLYDTLKWIAMVVLPAVATFYFVLAGVWNLPYAGQVVATITAVDTFLGALLGISSEKYKNSSVRFDGQLDIIKNDTSLVNQLEIKTPPDQLADQKEIVLKVNKVDIPLPSPPRN